MLFIYAHPAKIDSKDTIDVGVSEDKLKGFFDAAVVWFDRRDVCEVEPAVGKAADACQVVAADSTATR